MDYKEENSEKFGDCCKAVNWSLHEDVYNGESNEAILNSFYNLLKEGYLGVTHDERKGLILMHKSTIDPYLNGNGPLENVALQVYRGPPVISQ